VGETKVGGRPNEGVNTPLSAPSKVSDENKSMARQHPVLVAAMGGGLSLPTVTVTVPLALSFTSNGAGLAAGTVSVDPTSVSEASALDTLWSECRVLGGRFDFAPTALAEGQFVLVYDPVGNTALTSVVNGAQFAQHKLFSIAANAGTGGDSIVSTIHQGQSWSFPFKVPKGIKEGSTLGADQWSTTGTSTSYGYLKVYALGTASTALLSGVLYLKLAYRSRQ